MEYFLKTKIRKLINILCQNLSNFNFGHALFRRPEIDYCCERGLTKSEKGRCSDNDFLKGRNLKSNPGVRFSTISFSKIDRLFNSVLKEKYINQNHF